MMQVKYVLHLREYLIIREVFVLSVWIDNPKNIVFTINIVWSERRSYGTVYYNFSMYLPYI